MATKEGFYQKRRWSFSTDNPANFLLLRVPKRNLERISAAIGPKNGTERRLAIEHFVAGYWLVLLKPPRIGTPFPSGSGISSAALAPAAPDCMGLIVNFCISPPPCVHVLGNDSLSPFAALREGTLEMTGNRIDRTCGAGQQVSRRQISAFPR